jgi:hypothetical protein
MIYSAFPGTGKTYLAKHNPRFIDLESSDFQWAFADPTLSVEERKASDQKVKNPNFIQDYVQAIKEASQDHNVLIASQPAVLQALADEGLAFTTVTPLDNAETKQIYLQRYRERGNQQAFIDLMDKNYSNFINDLNQNPNAAAHLIIVGDHHLAQIVSNEAENKALQETITEIMKNYFFESGRASEAEAQLADLQEHVDFMLPH